MQASPVPFAIVVRTQLRNRTAIGLVLCVCGWSTLWIQPLIDFFVIPSELAAAAFFAGIAIGAWPRRRRAGVRGPANVGGKG